MLGAGSAGGLASAVWLPAPSEPAEGREGGAPSRGFVVSEG